MNERATILMLKLKNGEKSSFFIHSFSRSFIHLRALLQQPQTLTAHKEKALITVTIRVKLILKAFGYAVTILVGAFILAMITWTMTSNQSLTTCAFWSGLFLGILAVLTDELQKREALVPQQSHKQTAVTAHPNPPVLAQYVPSQYINHCRPQFGHFRSEIGSPY